VFLRAIEKKKQVEWKMQKYFRRFSTQFTPYDWGEAGKQQVFNQRLPIIIMLEDVRAQVPSESAKILVRHFGVDFLLSATFGRFDCPRESLTNEVRVTLPSARVTSIIEFPEIKYFCGFLLIFIRKTFFPFLRLSSLIWESSCWRVKGNLVLVMHNSIAMSQFLHLRANNFQKLLKIIFSKILKNVNKKVRVFARFVKLAGVPRDFAELAGVLAGLLKFIGNSFSISNLL
jgi:hypothetical protein